jgi:hypothetical protein
MVALPCPVIVVILVGMVILFTESVWAKRPMAHFTDGANAIKKKIPQEP